MAAAGPGRQEAGLGPLDDELPLEVGERGEDAEDQLARCRRGVDGGPMAGVRTFSLTPRSASRGRGST